MGAAHWPLAQETKVETSLVEASDGAPPVELLPVDLPPELPVGLPLELLAELPLELLAELPLELLAELPLELLAELPPELLPLVDSELRPDEAAAPSCTPASLPSLPAVE